MKKVVNFLGNQWGQRLTIIVLVMIVMAIFEPNFFKLGNATNILLAISLYGIMACGMLFVVLVGGMDLSVGSILGLSGIITGMLMRDGRYSQGDWSTAGVSVPLIADLTPPVTPVVTDGGKSQQSTTFLSASWTSNDPESGIVEYSYEIGSVPGGNDVLDWSSTTASEVNVTGLALTPGVTYYFGVKARNRFGYWSQVGYSDGITIQSDPKPLSIGIAKRYPDEFPVSLQGCVVTAVFPSEFFVENEDRSAGVRVSSSRTVHEGEKYTIDGYISRDETDRIVYESGLTPSGSGNIKPVFMTSQSLGGKSDEVIFGPTGGTGINNIGLLVKTYGKIKNTGTNCIYIDDGSKVPSVAGQIGVKVSVTSPNEFLVGKYVMVTGISSLVQDGTSLRRFIRTRSNADVVVVKQ
jgi:hypothetical protein